MHGTITCLAEIINNIYRAIDNKEHVAIVTLDLSKAFDCLNHQLLLQKLSKLGLNDPSISWMKAYLSNRSQVTKFKNFTSNIESPKTGVPQGSILGPLLFICFTNDLPPNFSNICTVNAYADDTQLLVTAKTVSESKKKMGMYHCDWAILWSAIGVQVECIQCTPPKIKEILGKIG